MVIKGRPHRIAPETIDQRAPVQRPGPNFDWTKWNAFLAKFGGMLSPRPLSPQQVEAVVAGVDVLVDKFNLVPASEHPTIGSYLDHVEAIANEALVADRTEVRARVPSLTQAVAVLRAAVERGRLTPEERATIGSSLSGCR